MYVSLLFFFCSPFFFLSLPLYFLQIVESSSVLSIFFLLSLFSYIRILSDFILKVSLNGFLTRQSPSVIPSLLRSSFICLVYPLLLIGLNILPIICLFLCNLFTLRISLVYCKFWFYDYSFCYAYFILFLYYFYCFS